MYILIKLQFIILFFLYLYFFTALIKKGFTFSLGILFGVLYFIFIPLSIFISTNVLEISIMDFSSTNLVDIVLEDNIHESLILIGYLYSILVFIYFSEFHNDKVPLKPKPSLLHWKSYFILALLAGLFIFIAAGIHQGGNWYVSREVFFKEGGSLALVLAFSYIALKIIFMASILTAYENREINFVKFIMVILLFAIIDIVLTGNRIYVFVLIAAIVINLIIHYKFKILLFGLFVIPFGYMLSIYRHMRGGLFTEGIPSLNNIIDMISKAIEKDPPRIDTFLLGISESVNFNVLYEVFNYITFNNALWGETFLKSFTFIIPRSLWPDKPLSITQFAGEWFAPESEHLSLVTTIIGEVHANFYLFGIVLLPIILFFTDQILKKVFSTTIMANMLFFILGLLIFRMPYSDILLVSIFIFIFIFYKEILFQERIRAV